MQLKKVSHKSLENEGPKRRRSGNIGLDEYKSRETASKYRGAVSRLLHLISD
jgi:hypothetical protein